MKNRLFLQTPTTDELKVLKHFLPSIKSDALAGASHEVKAKRAIADGFCGVCGEGLNSKTRSLNHPKYCKECHGLLVAGQTALVTMDGKYAFIQSDGGEETKHLVGRVIPIASADLTKLAESQNFPIQDVKNN